MNSHQLKQVEVIDSLEIQVKQNSLNFSTVAPVDDYENDKRTCLTSVHLLHSDLISKIQNIIINPLRNLAPNYFFYPSDSLHMTIKNVRVLNSPPHFTDEDIAKVKQVFESVVSKHHKFYVYFYRLFLFPNNLALIGTTDPELDTIFLDLDKKLNEGGVPDDKKYLNSQYVFSNITLARFNSPPSQEFTKKVKEITNNLVFEPYLVDSVTLLTCNAVLKNRNILHTWPLT